MEKIRVFGRLALLLLILVTQSLVVPVRADFVPPPDNQATVPGGSPDYPEVRLPPSPVDGPGAPTLQAELAVAVTRPLLNMRVLVLMDRSTDGGINDMITGYLDFLGVPYDVIDVSTRATSPNPEPIGPEFFQATDLWEGNHGKYYTIFVSTSVVWSPWKDGLGYALYSGLNQAERDLIREYEHSFGVRRVTWYAYPNADDYGLVPIVEGATEAITVTVPFTATFTPVGQGTFRYLQPEVPFAGPGVYGYVAEPAPGKQVTPLLQYNDGVADRTILAIYRPDNAGEHMVSTVSGFYPADPPTSIFTRLLPYGIINWATRGRFLGERHLYFIGQPDDVLASGDPYDFTAHAPVDCDVPGACETAEGPQPYRNEPDDLQNIVDWMTTFRATMPNAGNLTVELPFNGQGIQEDSTETGEIQPGTLTEKAAALEQAFTWLNHTYSHEDLGEADAALGRTQILSNTEVAELLGFTHYVTSTLLTGEYSGITNTTFITTAYELGIRYLLLNESVTDESLVGELVTSYKNPSPNTGIPYPGQPGLLLIPRYANNIFYFATTPAEEEDYYNAIPFYCPTYPSSPDLCFVYEEILDTVTNQALGFLLDFSLNPTMFHMNNLENYGGGRTLMTDFIESLYAKYNRYYAGDVPILSLPTQEIGARMWQRMAFNASGVQAVIGCDDTITITTQTAARIPFTGVDYGGTTETYAGQPISYFQMGDNDTVTIPGVIRIPMAPGGLEATTTNGDVALSWQSTVSYTDGGPLLGTVRYRVYRSMTRGFDIGSGTLIAETADTSYTDAGTAGDDYSYAVTAVGEDCWALESDVASADAIGLPAAPTDLTATVAGTADVTLNWQPVVSYTDSSALLGGVVYRLYHGTLPGFDLATGTLVTETANTMYVHPDAANAGYSYAVTAVGVDAWGLESAAARWNAVRTPAAPADLTATTTGADVALNWQPVLSYTDGGPLLGDVVYRLYRGALPGFDIATGTLVTETADTAYLHAAAGTAGYSYAVTAVGVDAWGLESAATRWNAVRTPAAPAELTATATGADVALDWQPVLSYTDGGPLLGDVVYRLYRDELPGFDIATATLVTETADTAYLHAAAAAAGYSYAVTAVGVDAWGLESAAARWNYVESPDEPIRVFLPLVVRTPEVLGQTSAARPALPRPGGR